MIKILSYNSFNNELKKYWSSLIENGKFSFFQTYEWNKYWYEKICKGDKFIFLNILVIFQNEELTDILPFYINKKKNLKILKIIGGVNTDFKSIIYSENSLFNKERNNEKVIKKLLLKNLPHFDIAIFDNQIKIKQNMNNTFLDYFNNIFLYNNYYLDFTNLTETKYFENILNKKTYKDTLRQIRRLKKIGNLNFKIINEEKDMVLYTKKMIELKSIQYSYTKQNHLFTEKKYRDFYTGLISNELLKRNLHISVLLLDDNLISIHYGFKYNHTLYYILPVYSKKWSTYSPGNILLYFLVKDCFNQKIKYFDFTEGENKYKLRWSNKKTSMYTSFFGNSLKGKMYFIVNYKIKNIIRKFIN